MGHTRVGRGRGDDLGGETVRARMQEKSMSSETGRAQQAANAGIANAPYAKDAGFEVKRETPMGRAKPYSVRAAERKRHFRGS